MLSKIGKRLSSYACDKSLRPFCYTLTHAMQSDTLLFIMVSVKDTYQHLRTAVSKLKGEDCSSVFPALLQRQKVQRGGASRN